MILSDRTIRDLGIVQPCELRSKFRGMSYGLSCCGYDVRVGDLPEGYRTTMTPDGPGIVLEPGQSALIGVREYFDMPTSVAGYVRDKSTWARRGLMVNQGVLEPNWKGYLCVRVWNVSSDELSIIEGEPIAQVVFHRIDEIPERTYSGKYQGQGRRDHGPRFER